MSKICDYQRDIYVRTDYLDIPGLSDTYHCMQSNCTATGSMPEHPLTNSHSHHTQWGRAALYSGLEFAEWIWWGAAQEHQRESWMLILTCRLLSRLTDLFRICITICSPKNHSCIHITRKPLYNSLTRMTATLMPTVRMYGTQSAWKTQGLEPFNMSFIVQGCPKIRLSQALGRRR